MAGNQLNNLQILDESSPYLVRGLESTDNLQITASLEVQNDVLITGNLTVQGTATSLQMETVNIGDNHLYLNDGYTTASAQSGGLVVNYLPTATADTVAGSFVAGVPATSNPTVVTTGSATFAVGAFVQISGSNTSENSGLFEVLSHVGTTLSIRGIGTTATVEDFSQNQFTADAIVAGSITQVNVSILRAGTDGIWETAVGSSTGLSFSDIGSGTGNSLQAAYVVGNTITTSAGEGSFIVAGTEVLQITSTAGLDVDTIADFDVTVFDVLMTGTNGFSIDGTAASNVTADAGNLTLSTTTSGNVVINSVADVDMDAVNILMDATAGFSLDGAAASNVTATGAQLQLSTVTSGELDITSAGLLDINAAANIDIDVTGTYDMLATSTFSIDGTGASNVSADSGTLTLSTTTSGNVIVNSVADIDADAVNILMDATAGISLDSAAASNFTATGAQLQISTVTSGELDLTSAGLLDINAAANLDIDVTGTYDMLATGAFSIDGTGASNVSADTGNLTLSTTTSGSVLITSFGDSTYTIPNASTVALAITDGTDTFMNVNSTAGAESVDFPFFVDIAGGAGISIVTNDALAAGDIVQIETDGDVGLADADTGSLNDALVMGVSVGVAAGGAVAQVHTVQGALIPVRFAAAPAGANNGQTVFLSGTAGQATLTPPSGVSVVRFQIGYLQGADGATTTPTVLFNPQLISRGPSVGA